MARTSNNELLKNVTGKIGEIVVKQYKDKIVISKKPDMSGVKPSALQQHHQSVFAKATQYARAINNNPVTKKEYAKKIKNGQDVYHYALQEYYRKMKEK